MVLVERRSLFAFRLLSLSESQNRVPDPRQCLAIPEPVPGKLMDERPVGHFSFGRLDRRDFHDQAVDAMYESRLSVLPAFFFGHSLLAILAMPSLFYPVVSVEEGFDGIANL